MLFSKGNKILNYGLETTHMDKGQAKTKADWIQNGVDNDHKQG